MDQFIRVSNDLIINVSSIFSICRNSYRSPEYDRWYDKYNSLLNDVIKEYINTNGDTNKDKENSDKYFLELRNKFDPYVKKNLISTIGECPKPFDVYYILKLCDGTEINITEEIFKSLLKIINVNMDNELINRFIDEEDDYNYDNCE